MAQASRRGPYGSSSSELGDLVAGAFVIVIVLLFIYLLVSSLVLPVAAFAGALMASTAAAPFYFSGPAWANLLWDVAFGAFVGLAIGLFQYRARVRNRLLEEALDSGIGRDVISAARLGWIGIAVHIAAGMLSGLALGLLGLFGPVQVMIESWPGWSGGPGYLALAHAGSLGGAGGPPDANALTALLAILIVILMLALLFSLLTTCAIAPIAWAATSGASKGIGRAIGTAAVVVMTPRHILQTAAAYPDAFLLQRGWFIRAMRKSIAVGISSAVLNAVLAFVCVRVADARIRDRLRSGLPLEELGTLSLTDGSAISCLAFMDRRRLAIVSWREMVVWDLASDKRTTISHGARWGAVAPDDATLVLIGYDPELRREAVRLWRMDGSRHKVVPLPSGQPESAGFSDDGRMVAIETEASGLLGWDLASGRPAHDGLRRHVSAELSELPNGARLVWVLSDLYKAALSPDRALLAVTGHASIKYVRLMGGDSEPLPINHEGQYDSPTAVAWRRDGHVLATVSTYTVRFWQVSSNKLLAKITDSGRQGPQWSAVAFSHDGGLLAAGSAAGVVRVWRVPDSRR